METKIPEANYKALSELVGKDIGEWANRSGRTMKFKAGGFMDLSLECLYKNRISMTHYYEQNGDLVPDPDMEIKINPENKTAHACHYQDASIYCEVYPEGNTDPKQFFGQNDFLRTWLGNIKEQGFTPVENKD